MTAREWWVLNRSHGAPSGPGLLYYYPLVSSRAATIVLLHFCFFARRDDLWGRLPTCGRLAIGLPLAFSGLKERRLHRFAACRYAGQVV